MAAASPTPRRARSGCSAATARWTSRNRSARSRSPDARSSTTSSSSSTATCSASTGRCAATARSCRSSRPISAARAGTSSSACGARAGTHLLARDTAGKLRQLMDECVDGEYQDFKSKDGAYIRKNFFGRYPETAAMVEDWTDAEIWALTRGGHDPVKVYAAYKAAVEHKGQPTVILAKTVKGYGMGAAGEGPDDRPSGQEARPRGAEGVPRPVPDSRLGRGPRQGSVPALRRGQRGDEISARAARGARRLSARPAGARASRFLSRRFPSSTRC